MNAFYIFHRFGEKAGVFLGGVKKEPARMILDDEGRWQKIKYLAKQRPN